MARAQLAKVELAFSTKAETLARAATAVKTAAILPLQFFSHAEWMAGSGNILNRILAAGWDSMIVRSSAQHEDAAGASQAGKYLSIPHVRGREGLLDAIQRVFASYGQAESGDQVLVQPMLRDVSLSGVAFTRDPNSGGPYLVINFETAGDTAAVTGGGGNLQTFVQWRGGIGECPARLAGIAALADELEMLFQSGELDIEFAVADGQLYLLQARPLACPAPPVDMTAHKALLSSIAAKIQQSNRPHPYLRGQRTVYGVMPDWNPAEIIGVRPRPLALSLYRNLVTDSVWAYQRHNYGYRNLRSFPLMVSFHGLPYIDVRVSFNSFIPGDIDDNLAGRLVDHYIDRLLQTPTLHDKVEFEIVNSCYSFDLPQRLSRLNRHGFDEDDLDTLSDSLRKLTNRVIHPDSGLWKKDSAKIATLKQRQETILTGDLDPLSRIYWLLEDCKRYGTLPFAGLARAGFIAVQMLRSLITAGIIDQGQYDAFMAGLDTVSGNMSADFRRLSRDAFLQEYGHLRPGTYDILSPRYDEAPDHYLDWSRAPEPAKAHPPFVLTLHQMRAIEKLIAEHRLDMDLVSLFDFIQAGIQGREYAKFVFTRSLSEALRLLTEMGAQNGFSAEDMSYFDAGLIDDLYACAADPAEMMAGSIARGKARYAETRQIVLPPLITGAQDVWSFAVPPTEPNFITQGVAHGPVRRHDCPPDQLAGAIVLIPSADPGFDWIFSRGIAGFITAYGGVNSHMAIRAGELNLPAVIGAGESLYAAWAGARHLRLDCAARRVEAA